MNVMKMKHIKLFVVVMLAGCIVAGCKKKKDKENEEELITTVKIVLTPVSGGAAQTFVWKDVDGAGGNAPVIDQIGLIPSTNYNCSLQFLNESVTPAEDITTEVTAEAVDHQVYLEVATVQLGITNLNKDINGLPLGITSAWAAGAVSNGSVKITLKHKPGQKAANDPVTKGETDVEVVFPVVIR
jgi:hypothetical protein